MNQALVTKPFPVTERVREAMAVSLRGCEELLPRAEWQHKLARSEATGVPLRIKLGLDPTAPDIHIGHTVVLNKMRQLQDLGHTVIFLIGDFTSMIGDPSGRNTTRPPLTREQIEANAETYCAQASLVLDPARTEIRYNSEWSDPLGARGMIQLAAKLHRGAHDGARRLPRALQGRHADLVHEFLYPLMQGYDSVALKSDLELGGTDQKFNLLMGRHLQQEYGQEPQCILTMPLLEGLDGVEKMSKSKNNYIGITEEANTMFAKVLSIRDDADVALVHAAELPQRSRDRASARREVAAGRNPKDAKVMLAKEITTRFHDAAAADAAEQDFVNRSKGGVPDEIPEVALSGAPLPIGALLKQAGLAPSTSEAIRLVDRAACASTAVVSDKGLKLAAGTYVVQVGKRKFARVTLG